jgi:hypothetical protein
VWLGTAASGRLEIAGPCDTSRFSFVKLISLIIKQIQTSKFQKEAKLVLNFPGFGI